MPRADMSGGAMSETLTREEAVDAAEQAAASGAPAHASMILAVLSGLGLDYSSAMDALTFAMGCLIRQRNSHDGRTCEDCVSLQLGVLNPMLQAIINRLDRCAEVEREQKAAEGETKH